MNEKADPGGVNLGNLGNLTKPCGMIWKTHRSRIPTTAFFPAPHGMVFMSLVSMAPPHQPSSQCWTSSSLFNDQNGDGVIGRGCSGMAWCTVELEPTEKWPATFFGRIFFNGPKRNHGSKRVHTPLHCLQWGDSTLLFFGLVGDENYPPVN